MAQKLIFVLIDGLRLDTAMSCLGYVQAETAAAGRACLPVRSELPSLSRPLYETLMTGVPPVRSGITSNAIVRRSHHPSVFDRCRAAGKVTAAAAYHWYSELYNQAPFEPAHRITHNEAAAIQHGTFYWRDDYPDDHLFADAEALRSAYDPDFLLLHPMATDNAGHLYGGNAPEYRAAARRADDLLARHMPGWLASEHIVIVTSDHGMSDDRMHGGPDDRETLVPFWQFGGPPPPVNALAQTEIAGLLCALMGLAPI